MLCLSINHVLERFMIIALAWQDHLVIALYLAAVIGIGWYSARRQKSGDEFFLASRSLPWWAVGISIMATLMSSLTYLSEPGEVWKSGVTNLLGKLLAIALELYLVLYLLIPFLMRFRFTSAYEYLEYRFNLIARRLGAALFCILMITWLGFVVLSVARSLTHASGMPLYAVIATVGVIGTVSTAAGGLRAVIWTEVAQFSLMLGGCVITIGYIVWATHSGLGDWVRASNDFLANSGQASVRWANIDPFARTSVLTVAISMFVWNLVTHIGNQMMVQRYFSLSDARAARRSFLLAQVFHVLIAVLLTITGLAIVYYYSAGPGRLSLNPLTEADLVFPHFMVEVLPPGLTGAVLAAVLAAAMSMMDSGINALATVISVERRSWNRGDSLQQKQASRGTEVSFARVITISAGTLITLAAFVLEPITRDGNILELLPRTFNLFVVPMGGLFLLGIFVPCCNGRAAVVAAFAGLAASFNIAYAHLLYDVPKVSFTWVLPCTLGVMLIVALLMSLLGRPEERRLRGLTWSRRHQRPEIDESLIAPGVTKNA